MHFGLHLELMYILELSSCLLFTFFVQYCCRLTQQLHLLPLVSKSVQRVQKDSSDFELMETSWEASERAAKHYLSGELAVRSFREAIFPLPWYSWDYLCCS
jgi:hypothetical protein